MSLDSCMHYWDISEFPFFVSSTKTTTTRDKVVFVDEFLGFNIYLHDRGQFWPGLEMGELISFQLLRNWPLANCRSNVLPGRVGLSYAKFLPRDTEWEGSFEVV